MLIIIQYAGLETLIIRIINTSSLRIFMIIKRLIISLCQLKLQERIDLHIILEECKICMEMIILM